MSDGSIDAHLLMRGVLRMEFGQMARASRKNPSQPKLPIQRKPPISSSPDAVRDVSTFEAKSDLRDSIVLEYFKAMRTEIDLRVRNHTTLVTSKVVASGGILAFLIRETAQLTPNTPLSVAYYGVLLVPLVAMLYDVMIANNIQDINRMGVFVRDRIEPEAPGIVLWEADTAQKSRWSRCYGLADALVLSLFTLGTILVVFTLIWDNGSTAMHVVADALFVLWLVVSAYMGICILGFHQSAERTERDVDDNAS